MFRCNLKYLFIYHSKKISNEPLFHFFVYNPFERKRCLFKSSKTKTNENNCKYTDRTVLIALWVTRASPYFIHEIVIYSFSCSDPQYIAIALAWRTIFHYPHVHNQPVMFLIYYFYMWTLKGTLFSIRIRCMSKAIEWLAKTLWELNKINEASSLLDLISKDHLVYFISAILLLLLVYGNLLHRQSELLD